MAQNRSDLARHIQVLLDFYEARTASFFGLCMTLYGMWDTGMINNYEKKLLYEYLWQKNPIHVHNWNIFSARFWMKWHPAFRRKSLIQFKHTSDPVTGYYWWDISTAGIKQRIRFLKYCIKQANKERL